MKRKPKILFVDIETSPNIATIFSLDPSRMAVNFRNILKERYIISVAWKWLGERRVHGAAIKPHRRSYKLFPYSTDKPLVELIAAAIAEADVVIGHWSTSFDMPWIRTRALFHGLEPIAPVAELDTCRWARRLFYFNSCKLGYLAQYLGVGGKIHTDHELWHRCILGDAKALAKMLLYNKHDVLILEQVFKKMRPQLPPAVNMRFFSDELCCEHCGSKLLQARGVQRTKAMTWQRYQCQKCGGWMRGNGKAISKRG